MAIKKLAGNEIRSEFLKFFKGKGHKIVPSSPLVPGNDPTLLFTNAGMVQFKDVFLGDESRPYARAASSQKCVRAGGKHNDLEEVGRTARHHTFFEMLGNFSFGDYFKQTAIEYAWEFITVTMGIPKDDLWITVFKDDDQARRIWNDKIGVSADRIMGLGEKDNFWSMGETGPCGPCSEIHLDRGEGKGCGNPDCSVECECDRFMELWNLVFMQSNRDSKGNMSNLPSPSIDTGMGLERIASVVQGTPGNFETDLISPIIEFISELTELPYGSGNLTDFSLRVVADHARAASFLIGDGVLPSNEGRGYVLRRIIRRALRHGKLLGQNDPFLYRVSGSVVELMKSPYPDLKERMNTIARVIANEEERFIHTLDYGMKILEDMISRLTEKGQTTLPGEEAFKLYDTYGFPLDLTQDISGEKGISVDREAFEAAMKNQRERARASWKGGTDAAVDQIYRDILRSVGPTRFVGYGATRAEAELKVILMDGKEVDKASEGDTVELAFAETPFYGESGGQVGDKGIIKDNGVIVKITETKKPLAQLTVHKGRVSTGEIRRGDTLTLEVDTALRASIAANHTATHLLHAALRQVLGDHVKQAGSLVSADRLRFDFTHFTAITARELDHVEDMVMGEILKNQPVETEETGFSQAMEKGAMALFGEKYSDKVRVVSISDFSAELCGGVHARATGDLGIFKIAREGSVAAGVRRIEALTGRGAYIHIKERDSRISRLCGTLRAGPEELPDKTEKLIERVKELERKLRDLKEKSLQAGAGTDASALVKEVKGIPVLAQVVEGLDSKGLRSYIDATRNRLGSAIVAVGTTGDGKVSLAVGVTRDLLNRVHAGNIIKEIAPVVGGRGGGRAEMAQAGGKEVDKVKEAVEAVYGVVERMVS